MDVWGITHRGTVREKNQDTYLSQVLPDKSVLMLVCDGMGGALAGNIASTLAVKTFMNEFLATRSQGESSRTKMERAATCANETVYRRAQNDDDCTGMGTTMVATLVQGGEALFINVGDSRAYHIGAHDIIRVTRDHSLVQDLVERGELTQDQARTHPHKNLITRAVGADPVLQTDFFQRTLAKGDVLLLCSDGLSNVLTEDEMKWEIHLKDSLEDCCGRLLNLALERGASDNVTVALVRYE